MSEAAREKNLSVSAMSCSTKQQTIMQQNKVLSSDSPLSRQPETGQQENGLSNKTVFPPIQIVQRKDVLSNSPASSPKQQLQEIVQRKNSLPNSPLASPRPKSLAAHQKNSLSTTTGTSSPRQRANSLATPRAIVQHRNSLTNSPAASPRERARTLSNSSSVSPRSKNSLSTSAAASSPRQSTNNLSSSPAASPRERARTLSNSSTISPLSKNTSSTSAASSPRQSTNSLSNSAASSPRQSTNSLSSSPLASPSPKNFFLPESDCAEKGGFVKQSGFVSEAERASTAENVLSNSPASSPRQRVIAGQKNVLSSSPASSPSKGSYFPELREGYKEATGILKNFDEMANAQIEVPLTVQLAEMRRQEEEVKRLNDGAIPISLETALALRKLLFGTGNYTFNIEWKRTRFTFRDVKSNFPYGLFMEKVT
ncbi:FAM188B2-like protein [Branchiostoma belcheri]|nr:FAM188B2-like protein [Branchiostoma belcheri]